MTTPAQFVKGSNKEQNLVNQHQVNKFENEYGELIQITAESMKEKYEYDWTVHDTLAFGQYAKTWEEYRPVMESDATSRAVLGDALSDNLGIVAMAYSALPIQNFASIQPLGDESGTVYFRKGIAVTDRGNVSKGDELISPFGAVNSQIESYINETQVASSAIADTAVLEHTFALGTDLIPGSVMVSVGAGKIKGKDDGEGHILGVGIDAENSTVNYETGAVVITFVDLAAKSVTTSDTIDVTYSQSTVAADTIPTMKWILQGKTIVSNYYVLQSQYSNISELVLRKKFGTDLSSQVGADLVSQVTSSVMFNAISKLRAASIRNEVATGVTVTWPLAAPAGISDADHRRTFDDKLIEATDQMYKIAGKGEVSTLVVGMSGKKILKSAGMKVVKNAVSGPHLCGMYDGVPVYYAPTSVIGDNEVLVIYRGANWYESALTYAPFLPITTVQGRATDNVLINAQAAYHAAGLESVMDGFCVRISLV